MCTAVTAATCHLFNFKAAGVTQVLWWRGQERCGCPGVQQVAAGRWGTFLHPSAGPGPGWPKQEGVLGKVKFWVSAGEFL